MDASTVGNLDLDIIDKSNKILDELHENKFEIIFLLGQDNLDFKKKDEFIIYQGSHGDRGAEIADIIYQELLILNNLDITLTWKVNYKKLIKHLTPQVMQKRTGKL